MGDSPGTNTPALGLNEKALAFGLRADFAGEGAPEEDVVGGGGSPAPAGAPPLGGGAEAAGPAGVWKADAGRLPPGRGTPVDALVPACSPDRL